MLTEKRVFAVLLIYEQKTLWGGRIFIKGMQVCPFSERDGKEG